MQNPNQQKKMIIKDQHNQQKHHVIHSGNALVGSRIKEVKLYRADLEKLDAMNESDKAAYIGRLAERMVDDTHTVANTKAPQHSPLGGFGCGECD